MNLDLRLGDSLAVLTTLEAESVDALVTDPPAGIGFMGKKWDEPGAMVERRADTSVRFDKVGGNHNPENNADKVRTNRVQGVKFRAALTPIFEECLRVLKPGAHGVVWALPRTSHWTAAALEDAGFEIRDVVVHLFGSGFPKSLNNGRAIDIAVCVRPGRHYDKNLPKGEKARKGDHLCPNSEQGDPHRAFGTALKPSSEHWILVRKPLDGTVASNVLAHGTGGINTDGCRIAGAVPSVPQPDFRNVNGRSTNLDAHARNGEMSAAPGGRWPANVALSHNDDCVAVGKRKVAGDARAGQERGTRPGGFGDVGADNGDGRPAGQLHGNEEIDAHECTPGCAVALLDAQSGNLTSGEPCGIKAGGRLNTYGTFAGGLPVTGYGDSGVASRFFYVAKPARSERDIGCDDLPAASGGEATGRADGSAGTQNPRAGAGRSGGARNIHPTVKPVDLMRWLCRLVTPRGGLVLDPFMGSGTTGVACAREGFRFIGIEREAQYMEIAKRRIRGDAPLLNRPEVA